MPYQTKNKTSLKRDLKGYQNDPVAREAIKEAILTIKNNPEVGEWMSGNMASIRKYAFYQRPGRKDNRPYLRLLYKVVACCAQTDCEHGTNPEPHCDGLVKFLFVKTREDCNQLYAMRQSYFEDL